MMVSGRAMIYLILLVKLKSRAMLPAKPQARETVFQTTSQCGSAIAMPFSSFPRGNVPLSGSVTLHVVTKAAIERTLARGPIVAAKRGIAVDANHQSLEVYVISEFCSYQSIYFLKLVESITSSILSIHRRY